MNTEVQSTTSNFEPVVVTLAAPFDPSADKFVKSMIARKVRSLIKRPEIGTDDRNDLTQDFMVRVIESLKNFDATRGDRYSFIAAVINRHVATVLRVQGYLKRSSGKVASL